MYLATILESDSDWIACHCVLRTRVPKAKKWLVVLDSNLVHFLMFYRLMSTVRRRFPGPGAIVYTSASISLAAPMYLYMLGWVAQGELILWEIVVDRRKLLVRKLCFSCLVPGMYHSLCTRD